MLIDAGFCMFDSDPKKFIMQDTFSTCSLPAYTPMSCVNSENLLYWRVEEK